MDLVEVGAGGGSQPCDDQQETASEQLGTSHSEMEQSSQPACSSASKPKNRKKDDSSFEEEIFKLLDSKGDRFDRFRDEVAECVRELPTAYVQEKTMREIRDIMLNAKYAQTSTSIPFQQL